MACIHLGVSSCDLKSTLVGSCITYCSHLGVSSCDLKSTLVGSCITYCLHSLGKLLLHSSNLKRTPDLTRLPSKASSYADGKGTSHWLIKSPTNSPSEIFVNFVFKLIHAASIYKICR